MFGNDTENWYLILKNKKKKKKISTNFWKFSDFLIIFFIFKCSKRILSIFKVLSKFWWGPRGSEEWQNLFLGESRSEKRSGTSRNEGRGIPRAIPRWDSIFMIIMISRKTEGAIKLWETLYDTQRYWVHFFYKKLIWRKKIQWNVWWVIFFYIRRPNNV
jgi:hypothetical protein